MRYNLFVTVFFLFVQYKYGKAKHVLTIGALFHEDEDDLAVAFTYALHQHNTFYHDIAFVAEIDRVLRTDTFRVHRTICNWTQRGDGLAAIVGPTSPKTSFMAESIAQTLEIPHIQVQWKPARKNYDTQLGTEMTMNFYPDQDLLAHGIYTIAKSLDWKHYVILYEDVDSLIRIQDVLKIAKRDDEPVVIKQLVGNDYRTVLKEFKEDLIYRIILDCTPSLCLEVLKQAKEVGFLESFYGYFLTNLDSHTLNISSLDTRANITTIRLVDPTSKRVMQAVRNWQLGEIHHNNRDMNITPETMRTELGLMDDAIAHLTDSISQLHMTEPIMSRPLSCDDDDKWEGGIRIASFMKVHPMFYGATGTSKFDARGRRDTFTLDVIEFDNEDTDKIAEWSSGNKDVVTITRSDVKKQKTILGNLQGELIIVSSKLGEPYLSERKSEFTGEPLTGNARYFGYSLDVINAIAEQLNFTFEFRLNKDDTNGAYNNKTKKWNGIMSDLIERRAHLAICDLTMTQEREAVVDFSVPYMTLGISILYQRGKEAQVDMFAFLNPLEMEVWLYIVTAFAILPLIMFMLTRFAPGDWVNPQPFNKNPTELENVWTLKNCLWLVLGSTMSCGCYMMPKGISSRMGISMWWFLILIISNSYKANLTAFLTKQGMGVSINSAEALSKQNKVKFGTVQGGSTQGFFKNAKNNKVYERMWSMMSEDSGVFEKTNGEGVKRVLNTKNQGYAFLMESTQIEYEIAKNCDLKQVGGLLDSKSYGIAMPLDSPYRSEINRAILRLQEDGTLRKLKRKWWKEMLKKDEECPSDDGLGKAFTYAHVKGVFLVLIIGIGLAFSFTVIDFLWNARKIVRDHHIPFFDALTLEMRFALKILKTRKQTKHEVPPTPPVSEARSVENTANEIRDSTYDLHSVKSKVRIKDDNL